MPRTLYGSVAFMLAFALLAHGSFAAPKAAKPRPSAQMLGTPALPQVSAERIGTLTVRTYGSGKQSLVLIPGLACGAWVWDKTVLDFEKDYTVTTVTLAGFDGTPPPADQTSLLDGYLASIAQLIAAKHLVKPIIVGHSLGGHLAVRLAEQDPDALGGVVVLDSLPLYPPLQPAETLDSRKKSASTIALQIIQEPKDQFAAFTVKTCRSMVTDPKRADIVAKKCLRSDRATVANNAAEMMQTDYGPKLPQATVPMLLLVPAPSVATANQIKTYYMTAFQGAPTLDVQTIVPSRHFIMLDQPVLFESALRGFLIKHGGATP